MAGILQTQYDISKAFLWNRRTQRVNFTNGTGSPVTLPLGRLMGRIATTQFATPHSATATDGSQQPIGVLFDDYTVAAGATVTLTIADGGDVAEEKIVLQSGQTLSTQITAANDINPGVSIRDAIARNTGLKLVSATELTGFDNVVS